VGGWMDGYIQPRNRYIFHFWHRVNQNEIMKKHMFYTNHIYIIKLKKIRIIKIKI
jgi:hypothetical protein